jgi:hypothetical protein
MNVRRKEKCFNVLGTRTKKRFLDLLMSDEAQILEFFRKIGCTQDIIISFAAYKNPHDIFDHWTRGSNHGDSSLEKLFQTLIEMERSDALDSIKQCQPEVGYIIDEMLNMHKSSSVKPKPVVDVTSTISQIRCNACMIPMNSEPIIVKTLNLRICIKCMENLRNEILSSIE